MSDETNREMIEQITADDGRSWEAPTVLHGDEAVKASRELLAWAGHPTLEQHRAAGKSPKRQVRLPASLNSELDEWVKTNDTNASQVIRAAITEYLASRRSAAR